MDLPGNPYLYLEEEPHAGPDRPISQGDVFVGIPLVGPAMPHPKQEGTWVSPKPRTGQKALGMLVTHPCASRSRTTFKLNPVVSIAPVVRCPDGFEPPWNGYFDLFPLPNLRNGENYVAKLSEVCPVPSAALDGRRISCLGREGLQGLFHRLAMNSIRYPEIPAHFEIEADKLSGETDLWQMWVAVRGSEDGFQAWLNEPFGGQLREDADGQVVPGSADPTGESRRNSLAWNLDEVRSELEAELKS